MYIDKNKLFAKTSHNPSIITDFECKIPKWKISSTIYSHWIVVFSTIYISWSVDGAQSSECVYTNITIIYLLMQLIFAMWT